MHGESNTFFITRQTQEKLEISYPCVSYGFRILFKAYPCDVAASCSDTMNIETDSSSRLGDEGTLLQSIVDSFNAVVMHRQQETAEECIRYIDYNPIMEAILIESVHL